MPSSLECLICLSTLKINWSNNGKLSAEEKLKRLQEKEDTFRKILSILKVNLSPFSWNCITDGFPFCSNCTRGLGKLINFKEKLLKIENDIDKGIDEIKKRLRATESHHKVGHTDVRVVIFRGQVLGTEVAASDVTNFPTLSLQESTQSKLVIRSYQKTVNSPAERITSNKNTVQELSPEQHIPAEETDCSKRLENEEEAQETEPTLLPAAAPLQLATPTLVNCVNIDVPFILGDSVNETQLQNYFQYELNFPPVVVANSATVDNNEIGVGGEFLINLNEVEAATANTANNNTELIVSVEGGGNNDDNDAFGSKDCPNVELHTNDNDVDSAGVGICNTFVRKRTEQVGDESSRENVNYEFPRTEDAIVSKDDWNFLLRKDSDGRIFASSIEIVKIEKNKYKGFSCGNCGVEFACKDLKRNWSRVLDHIQGVHLGGYSCTTCKITFSKKSLQKKHFDKKHKKGFNGCATLEKSQDYALASKLLPIQEDNESCKFCGRVFSQKDDKDYHELSHTIGLDPRRNVPCHLCDKKYPSKYSLRNHITFAHKGKGVQCLICKTAFDSHNALRRHSTTHLTIEAKPFSCSICGKRYTKESYRDHHQTQVHNSACGDKPEDYVWPCDVCGQKFKNKTLRKNHYRHHPNRKFDRREEIPITERTGEKEGPINKRRMKSVLPIEQKPLKCGVCARRFVKLESVKNHEAKHGSDKPKDFIYPCEVCGQRFKLKKLRQYHYRHHPQFMKQKAEEGSRNKCCTVNNTMSTFKCPTCNLEFTSKHRWVNHYVTHVDNKSENKAYACSICSKRFTHQTYAERHEVSQHGPCDKSEDYIFPCEVCGYRFKNRTLLRYHYRHHPNRPLMIAEGKEKDKNDIRESLGKKLGDCSPVTKEKPLKCFICFKRFKTQEAVKSHQSKHDPKDKTEDYPYSCEVCDHRFKSKTSCKYHYRCHPEWKAQAQQPLEESNTTATTACQDQKKGSNTNGKIISKNKFTKNICKLCNRTILKANKFEKHHFLTHRKDPVDKSFSCTICDGERFDGSESVKEHESSHPANDKPEDFDNPCELCGYRCTSFKKRKILPSYSPHQDNRKLDTIIVIKNKTSAKLSLRDTHLQNLNRGSDFNQNGDDVTREKAYRKHKNKCYRKMNKFNKSIKISKKVQSENTSFVKKRSEWDMNGCEDYATSKICSNGLESTEDKNTRSSCDMEALEECVSNVRVEMAPAAINEINEHQKLERYPSVALNRLPDALLHGKHFNIVNDNLICYSTSNHCGPDACRKWPNAYNVKFQVNLSPKCGYGKNSSKN